MVLSNPWKWRDLNQPCAKSSYFIGVPPISAVGFSEIVQLSGWPAADEKMCFGSNFSMCDTLSY